MTETPLDHAVAAAREPATALLAELVRLDTQNPPGDTDAASETLAARLETLGLSVERHPVPAPFARQHGRRSVTNLVVRERFGEGLTIALHAPLDTLPAGYGWHHDPLGAETRDGRLYGRGARDSKGDIAAYVAALLGLRAAGQRAGTVELHITADEETGGFLGPAFLIGQGLCAPDVAIGAGTTHQVVVGQQGVLHLEAILRGRQAHASAPHDGESALAAAVPVVAALIEAAETAPQPLTVSTISGGRGVNLVPDRVRLTVDRRLAPHEDGEAVEAGLIARIEAAHKNAAVELECRRLLLAEPLTPTPQAERIAAVLSRHGEAVLGTPVPVASAPVVTGARHYAAAGMPTALYGVGPPTIGEGVDLAADEFVVLDDVVRAARVVAAATAELLNG